MIIFQERWLEETEAGIDGGEAQGMEDERLLEWSWTGEVFYPARALRALGCVSNTGRWCPHSGKGEDFLTGQLNFFTETAVTPECKVEKLFPRWEINRHAEG